MYSNEGWSRLSSLDKKERCCACHCHQILFLPPSTPYISLLCKKWSDFWCGMWPWSFFFEWPRASSGFHYIGSVLVYQYRWLNANFSCCKVGFGSCSCLVVQLEMIADVATTVFERPFSCLEILVHTTDSNIGTTAAEADAPKTSSREEVDFPTTTAYY